MAGSRAIGRDVHFYHFAEPDNALGGMILNPSVTERIFLLMLDILIDASGPYWVTSRSTGETLALSDEPLKRGHYDIRPHSRKGTISLTRETCITRVLSRTRTGRDDAFRQLVRERDGKCVITGLVNTEAYRNDWTSFHACHIFPISFEEYFVQKGFSGCITNRADERDTGINSCQNGLLMQSNVHERFDKFLFSVNPDDGYKVTCFDGDPLEIDGKVLDPICRDPNDERSVKDELLRWHFRQAVLANMKGTGEPNFETDFPPGTDMMGEILGGPDPTKRMEAELFSRLNGMALNWLSFTE
ncbi:HNH endonuclease-domain-containing protein [Lipomyces kononenkoae]|uniref:HNH endonuclease-domain-containing protein n=1 Tax=Lipomyces kononenkoae TaxID=34357 RepID=A0ACC3SX36_LIPKO